MSLTLHNRMFLKLVLIVSHLPGSISLLEMDLHVKQPNVTESPDIQIEDMNSTNIAFPRKGALANLLLKSNWLTLPLSAKMLPDKLCYMDYRPSLSRLFLDRPHVYIGAYAQLRI